MGDSSLGGSRERSLGPAGTKLQQKPKRLCLTGPDSRKCGAEPRRGGRLVRFAPLLLAQSLPRKRFFGPAFFARLHVEAVLLDFLDDVFLLHLALEAAQGIFQRLTFLDNDFSHFYIHPQSGSDWLHAAPLLRSNTAPGHYRMPATVRSRTLVTSSRFNFPQSAIEKGAPWTTF